MNPELSLGALIKRTIQAYISRFWSFITLTTVPYIPIALGLATVFLMGKNTVLTVTLVSITVITFVSLIYFLPRLQMAGILIAQNQTLTIKEAYAATKGKVLSYYGISIIALFVTIGAFFLFVIPGIYVSMFILFVLPILVFENERGLKAVMRAREYMRGRWWKVFGYFLVFMLLAIIAQSLVGMIGKGVFNSVLTTLFSILVAPVGLIYTTIMYDMFRTSRPIDEAVFATRKKKGYVALMIFGVLAPILMIGTLIAYAPKIFGMFQDNGFFVATTESTVVTDETNNLSFTIPAGWRKLPTPAPSIVYSNDMGAVVLYGVPVAEGLSKGETDITKALTTDEFKAFLLADAPDMEIESVETVMIDGVPAYKGISKDVSEYEVAYGQSYFFIHKGTEYLIILATSEKHKPVIDPQFKSIIESVDMK